MVLALVARFRHEHPRGDRLAENVIGLTNGGRRVELPRRRATAGPLMDRFTPPSWRSKHCWNMRRSVRRPLASGRAASPTESHGRARNALVERSRRAIPAGPRASGPRGAGSRPRIPVDPPAVPVASHGRGGEIGHDMAGLPPAIALRYSAWPGIFSGERRATG